MARPNILMAGATLVFAFLALPAGAQTRNWAGPYLGVTIGGAAGTTDARTASPSLSANEPSTPSINTVGAQNLGPGGLAIGGQGGFNWQSGNLVYGAELDFGVLDMSGSRSGAGNVQGCFPCTFTINQSVSTGWLVTAGPHLGFAFDNFLLSGNAGLAVTDLQYQSQFSQETGSFAASVTQGQQPEDKIGWTVGATLDYGLDAHWVLRAEYRYADFGTVSSSNTLLGPGPSFPFTFKTNLDVNILRVGVNYQF